MIKIYSSVTVLILLYSICHHEFNNFIILNESVKQVQDSTLQHHAVLLFLKQNDSVQPLLLHGNVVSR